ncbi:hypothetical protein CTI12_AA323240 [Artemisia annua]|uniref:Uncharacterized protein n=1 Tax=Artemisia annua TaxID=35608 RepID=A0A2U1N0F0_ARTAN|nr:hypothetical protein CTI12_AA323240 [Artemisia annua]
MGVTSLTSSDDHIGAFKNVLADAYGSKKALLISLEATGSRFLYFYYTGKATNKVNQNINAS